MTRLRAIVAGVLLAGGVASAPAATLDRVRAAGVVQCGGPAGPGLAMPGPDGAWQGLLVDVCRAVAVAALGRDAGVAFHPYVRDAVFAARADDIAFVTVGDLIGHALLDAMLPGPAVFYRSIGLMVADRAPVADAAHLGEGAVCFEPGSPADRAVENYFAAHHLRLHPMPFQEADEMRDAFDDGRCEAVAEDVTVLAALRTQLDDRYRILPDVIAATPLLAASSLDDARWGAVIAWTVATLVRAEANGGLAPGERAWRLMPVVAPSLGLTPDWQGRVIAAVGDYAAIYRRHLGAGSPLGLPRGINALREQGGVLVAPETQ